MMRPWRTPSKSCSAAAPPALHRRSSPDLCIRNLGERRRVALQVPALHDVDGCSVTT